MSSAPIFVYTLPGCQPCRLTKAALKKAGIAYRETDLSTDPRGFEIVHELGYQQAPVVVAGDVSWSGYRPDQLAKLV